ncbi:MAG: aminopeptidase [Chloroflexota bacterium]|nr:MAG: aminopeptidase [Chloroflexota bacterium]
MIDPRTQKLAHILVNHSARIQPGDRVAIEATIAAEPLVRELYIEILKQGGHPYLLLDFAEQTKELFTFGNEKQISCVNELRQFSYENFESRIRIHSLTNVHALSDFSPEKQAQHQKGAAPIIATQMKRGATGDFKWVSTLFPTLAYAEEAGMGLREYEDFVYRACHADESDPIAYWENLKNEQHESANIFNGHKTVKLNGPNIDITLSIEGRTFINSYGIHNMPDGEVFTGPVENSANGWVRYTYPAIYNGVIVEGIELNFEDGKVIKATAEKNEAFLHKMLDSDEGSRYLGEFAVGTNFQIDTFTGNILFDEKIGGTIHMALGAGYPQTGSVNKSMIHWDMICDMRSDSEIQVDGEVIYKDGDFVF